MIGKYLGTGFGCSEPAGTTKVILALKVCECSTVDVLPLLFCREAAKVYNHFPSKYTAHRIMLAILQACADIPQSHITNADPKAEVYVALEWFFNFD